MTSVARTFGSVKLRKTASIGCSCCGFGGGIPVLPYLRLGSDLSQQHRTHFGPEQAGAPGHRKVLALAVENLGLERDLSRDARRIAVVGAHAVGYEADLSWNGGVRAGIGLRPQYRFDLVGKAVDFLGDGHVSS